MGIERFNSVVAFLLILQVSIFSLCLKRTMHFSISHVANRPYTLVSMLDAVLHIQCTSGLHGQIWDLEWAENSQFLQCLST